MGPCGLLRSTAGGRLFCLSGRVAGLDCIAAFAVGRRPHLESRARHLLVVVGRRGCELRHDHLDDPADRTLHGGADSCRVCGPCDRQCLSGPRVAAIRLDRAHGAQALLAADDRDRAPGARCESGDRLVPVSLRHRNVAGLLSLGHPGRGFDRPQRRRGHARARERRAFTISSMRAPQNRRLCGDLRLPACCCSARRSVYGQVRLKCLGTRIEAAPMLRIGIVQPNADAALPGTEQGSASEQLEAKLRKFAQLRRASAGSRRPRRPADRLERSELWRALSQARSEDYPNGDPKAISSGLKCR